MNPMKTTMWQAMKLSGLSAMGCGFCLGGCSRQEKVYVQQPQASAEQQPQYLDQEPQSVIVQDAPPPEIVEAQPPAPSAGYVWVGGYWNWDSTKYSWQAGHYATPPQRDAAWVAPRYEKDAHGTRYTPGRWAKPAASNGNDPGRDNDKNRPNQ